MQENNLSQSVLLAQVFILILSSCINNVNFLFLCLVNTAAISSCTEWVVSRALIIRARLLYFLQLHFNYSCRTYAKSFNIMLWANSADDAFSVWLPLVYWLIKHADTVSALTSSSKPMRTHRGIGFIFAILEDFSFQKAELKKQGVWHTEIGLYYWRKEGTHQCKSWSRKVLTLLGGGSWVGRVGGVPWRRR